MKRIRNFILLFLLFLIAAYAAPVLEGRQAIKEHPKLGEPVSSTKPVEKLEKTAADKWASMIGKPIDRLIQDHGEAKETVKMSDGSLNMVFGETVDDYLHAHVDKTGLIDKLFIFGQQVTSPLFKIGMSLPDVSKRVLLSDQVNITLDNETYQVDLTGNDINTKPLIPFDNNSYAILHLDQESGQTLAISYLSAAALVADPPYQQLIDPNAITKRQVAGDKTDVEFKQRQMGEVLQLVFKRLGIAVEGFDSTLISQGNKLLQNLKDDPKAIFKSEARYREWQAITENQKMSAFFALEPEELQTLFKSEGMGISADEGLLVAPVNDVNLFVMAIFSGEFGQHPLDVTIENMGYGIVEDIALLVYQNKK